MKKILFIILIFSLKTQIFAFSVSPGYEAKGLSFFTQLSYDNIFNSDYKYFVLDIFGFSIFPPSPKFTLHMNYLSVPFSLDVKIFDLNYGLGFTVYPFKKIFSISGNFNFGWSIFIFNHFSYITDLKLNVDIPIYKGHNISIGSGLRHRNALRISNWLNLDENYFKSYNSYFFEIGYRFIFK